MNKIIITTIAILFTVTIVLGTNTVIAEEKKIPEWVKGIFGFYVEDKIQDSEMIDALEFLIEKDIIKLGEKTYEPFSKEKFSETGGFNPAWLEGEREKIIETCKDARSDGYENPYCQYVQ